MFQDSINIGVINKIVLFKNFMFIDTSTSIGVVRDKIKELNSVYCIDPFDSEFVNLLVRCGFNVSLNNRFYIQSRAFAFYISKLSKCCLEYTLKNDSKAKIGFGLETTKSDGLLGAYVNLLLIKKELKKGH